MLPKFVKGNNATVHTSICMAPAKVTNSDILTIWRSMNNRLLSVQKESNLE